MRKCVKKGCVKLVPDEYEKKTCPHCLELARARNKRHNATAKGKASQKRRYEKAHESGYYQSEGRKASVKRRYDEPKAIAKRSTETFRASRKRAQHKWSVGPKGLARRRSIMQRVSVKICGMLDSSRPESATVRSLCGWANREDAQAHFEMSMDKSWMTWENHGVRKRGDPPRTKWHIGHRIPRAAYNKRDEEDVRRCWHPSNLFAQDAVDNQAKSHRILPPDEELLQLQTIWPASWMGALPVRV